MKGHVFLDAPPGDELDALVRACLSDIAPSPVGSDDPALSDRLYYHIRANIKRGPIFRLDDALKTGRADCLAYCKLYTVLGRRLGLDAGVVDVVIDVAGRYVPHTCVMVRTRSGNPRFLDLWYGARDIRHRRLGLRVRVGNRWVVRDVNRDELRKLTVTYLPEMCVDGITLYVTGNRHLNRREYEQAIECYTESLRLYPQGIRAYYNRAIAWDSLAETVKAKRDYARALKDDSAVIRSTAQAHDEVTNLMQLDIKQVDETVQEMYLLRHGFITGRTVPVAVIALRFGVSEARVRERVGEAEMVL